MDEEFIKDRNEALTSMDKDKIKAYCEKYSINLPSEPDEVFWAGIRKAICELFLLEDSPVTVEQYNECYDWLIEHGYNPSIED